MGGKPRHKASEWEPNDALNDFLSKGVELLSTSHESTKNAAAEIGAGRLWYALSVLEDGENPWTDLRCSLQRRTDRNMRLSDAIQVLQREYPNIEGVDDADRGLKNCLQVSARWLEHASGLLEFQINYALEVLSTGKPRPGPPRSARADFLRAYDVLRQKGLRASALIDIVLNSSTDWGTPPCPLFTAKYKRDDERERKHGMGEHRKRLADAIKTMRSANKKRSGEPGLL